MRRMFHVRTAIALALGLALTAAAGPALAQTTLRLRAESGQALAYKASITVEADAEFVGIPFPKLKMAFNDVEVRADADLYWLVDQVTDDGAIKGRVAVRNLELFLGGFLPGAMFLDMVGMGGFAIPEIGFSITDRGKITGVELDMTGLMGDMKMGGMGGGMQINPMEMMTMILPMMVELLPAVLPADPVAVGDSWTIKLDMGGGAMPMMPVIDFNFTLESVDGAEAAIAMKRAGQYDGAMLKGFLALIPGFDIGGEDFTLADLDIKADWDDHGTVALDIESGRPLSLRDNTNSNIDFRVLIRPVAHNPDKNWELSGKMNIRLGLDIEFAESMSVADYEERFPPPAPEEAEDPDADEDLDAI